MTNKKELKNLRQLDTLQLKFLAVAGYIKKNQTKTLQGIAVLVVALVAAVGFMYVREHQRLGRLNDLASIDNFYLDQQKEVQKKRSELQEKIDLIQAKVKPDLNLAAAKVSDVKEMKSLSPQDLKKVNEYEKTLKDLKEDYSASAAKYEEFFATHKNNTEGRRSGLTAAQIYLKEKKFDKAKTFLEEVVAKANKNEIFYQTQVRYMLVGVLEELKLFDEALAQLKTLEANSNKEDLAKVLLVQGKVLIAKKDNEGAKAVLSRIQDEYGQSEEAQKAQSLQAVMELL